MKRKLLLLIGILLIVSLACSTLSFGGADEPDAEPTADVTMDADTDDGEDINAEANVDDIDDDEPEQEENADQDAALTYDSEGLDQLDSYRATMSYQMEKSDGTVELFSIEQAATREPAAQQMIIASAEGDIEYIQIEEQMWIRFGEEWIQASSDSDALGDDDFGSMLSGSNEWISEVEDEDYTYLGKETVNDIKTKHYQITYSEGWMGMLGDANADDDIESGVADVWVANQTGLPEFVVRYRVEVEGTLDGKAGTMSIAMDVTEVNKNVTIEAPEGVATGGLPEGVPVYPGAEDVTSFGGMSTFTVPDDVETVNTFYTDALTSAGWENSSDGFAMENMVSSSWTKDNAELTLMLTADDEGLVTVLITVTPDE